MSKLIYIVEDERDIADVVAHYLEKDHFRCRIIADGAEAWACILKTPPDLVVLDLMLPGMDGLELCRLLRAEPRTRDLPVIMLTARGDETDRVVGLEMGADDYVAKPFSPKELVARIKAVLRRGPPPQAPGRLMRYGRLVLDDERHTVAADRREVELSAKEFGLLRHLMQRPGRLVSRGQLLDAVWGADYVGGDRTVDVHVRHLRKKIPLLQEAIVTVKSYGYKLREKP